MKSATLLTLFMLTSAAFATDDDIRSKVVESKPHNKLSSRIDPDREIYGTPFGTSEDKFIASHGKPTGYLRLNDDDTVMIYGKSHAFVFEQGKLAGVRITGNVIDWELSNGLIDSTPFDGIKWRLDNGIESEMNLKEVKKILDVKLSTKLYQHYYFTEKARVQLDFSHYTQEGDNDEAFRLHGIFVTAK